jgi:hypothetical protein
MPLVSNETLILDRLALPMKRYTLQRNVVKGTKGDPTPDTNAEPVPEGANTDLEKDPAGPSESKE